MYAPFGLATIVLLFLETFILFTFCQIFLPLSHTDQGISSNETGEDCLSYSMAINRISLSVKVLNLDVEPRPILQQFCKPRMYRTLINVWKSIHNESKDDKFVKLLSFVTWYFALHKFSWNVQNQFILHFKITKFKIRSWLIEIILALTMFVSEKIKTVLDSKYIFELQQQMLGDCLVCKQKQTSANHFSEYRMHFLSIVLLANDYTKRMW